MCVSVQFRMKECGVAEIVKSDAVVTASQPSLSSSSATDISSVVKSSTQNGMAKLLISTYMYTCYVYDIYIH